MPHARVIVNPAAGAGRGARIWPDIAAQLKGLGLTFEHDFSHTPGHAAELAKLAAAKGHKLIVAVGGGGTIHEIVNGLHQAGALGDVALGIVSAGTGCAASARLASPMTTRMPAESF